MTISYNLGTVKGNKGDKGDTGDTGATGAKGEKGDKGDKGDTGDAAGFGTISATINNNTGTPSVNVTTSGSDTAKNILFAFANLKGAKGDKGDKGDTGATGEKGAKGDPGQSGTWEEVTLINPSSTFTCWKNTTLNICVLSMEYPLQSDLTTTGEHTTSTVLPDAVKPLFVATGSLQVDGSIWVSPAGAIKWRNAQGVSKPATIYGSVFWLLPEV